MPSLELMRHIEIPRQVASHRFVLEALRCAESLCDNRDPRHRVIGTSDGNRPELYGWAPNVKPHRDKTGWMYALMLNDGISYIHARKHVALAGGGESHQIRVQAGDIFVLNDFCEHWTEDVTPRVAMFIGCFDDRCDAEALAKLQSGLTALAAGEYYGAPRVKEGYRSMSPDECFVSNSDMSDAEVMLLADARRQERLVVECHCGQPAVELDRHWPYFWDHCVCAEHRLGRAQTTTFEPEREAA